MTGTGFWGRIGPARSARAAMVVLVAALLATFLLAPAASAKRTTTTSSTTTTTTTVPTAWDPRLQPIADKVAELRGLTFDHPVTAEFLDDAAFEKKVAVDRGKLAKDDKADIARAQAQLRALGLIGSDVDIVKAIESLQQSGVLAYYDPKKKTITVKGTNLDDVATRVTVAHELTHALQDQHFDLQKLEKAAKPLHGSTALRALVEGDAVRIQTDYEHSLSADEQQAYTTENAATGKQAQAEITAKGVPDTLTTAFQMPYALGQPMVTAVAATSQAAGVDALFANPPVADATFVTPTTLLDGHAFQTVETPALVAGEKRSGKPDQFGSFSLFQVLASAARQRDLADRCRCLGRRLHGDLHAEGHDVPPCHVRRSWHRRHRDHHRRAQQVGGADAGRNGDRQRHRRSGDADRLRPWRGRHRDSQQAERVVRVRREP